MPLALVYLPKTSAPLPILAFTCSLHFRQIYTLNKIHTFMNSYNSYIVFLLSIVKKASVEIAGRPGKLSLGKKPIHLLPCTIIPALPPAWGGTHPVKDAQLTPCGTPAL